MESMTMIEGCHFCNKKKTVRFPIGKVHSGKLEKNDDPKYAEYAKYLVKTDEKAKEGSFWECKKCRSQFWSDSSDQELMHIPYKRKYYGMTERWMKSSLDCTQSIKDGLSKVRGMGSWFPCKAVLKSGYVCDPCYIVFSNEPPIVETWNYWHDHVYFIDEVESIDRSKFVLNDQIRLATRLAHETNNGYYPTFIQDGAGEVHVLNGPNDFIVDEVLKASDMTLYGGYDVEKCQKAEIISLYEGYKTIIYAGWDPGIQQFNIKPPQHMQDLYDVSWSPNMPELSKKLDIPVNDLNQIMLGILEPTEKQIKDIRRLAIEKKK